MKLMLRFAAPVALAASVAGCSLGGMLGGGGKAPATLLTLTPEATNPGPMTRSANAGQAVTVVLPVAAKELRTVRIPVQVNATQVQYVANLQWIDTPDRLFKDLVAETLRRTTNRVVLDTGQTGLDPGLLINGRLEHFGYDAATGTVIVEYDGAMSTAGGTHVETRRFVATVPADGTAGTVGPALNRAANDVAQQVAAWVGG